MGLVEAKAELRAFVRLTRSARSTHERAATEPGFANNLAQLADVFAWERIAAFLPTAVEPPISGHLDALVAAGVSVIVPVATAEGFLNWIELEPGAVDDTMTDAMGMPIPARGEEAWTDELDAILVPAAAVDREGNRLGWGKGYYDRFLASEVADTLVVAVVFDADIVDEIPTEPHDRPVNAIVTEASITFVQ